MDQSVKNGKFEFYRFMFSLYILFFHQLKYLIGEPPLKSLSVKFFPHGSIGVEFFFLLTGFLLGKTAFKKASTKPINRSNLGSYHSSKDSFSFIVRKYLRIFPYHAVAFVITLIAYIVSNHLALTKTIYYIINNIPAFFLVQMSGLSVASTNHLEWYISSLLICSALIYPLCRRFYYGFTRYAAPLFSLIILGILFYNTSSLTGVMVWMRIGYKGTIRAFVEISLGTTAYEISRVLKGRKTYKQNSSIRHMITLIVLGPG